MPRAPKSPCRQPGCAALVEVRGYCDTHEQRLTQRSAPRRPRSYDKRRWRDHIRPAKLRAQPLCEYCLAMTPPCITQATEVDHCDGDNTNDAPENHVSTCKPCHSHKTATRDGGFGNGWGRGG